MGRGTYPNATDLCITADAGGSNGRRSRVWKREPQRFAAEISLTVQGSHFPPGTSEWNKIEHRLSCHITANWRGTPLTTCETVVDRIGNTRTAAGLRVRAELDHAEYPTRMKVTQAEMDAIALVPADFHGTAITNASRGEVGKSISIAVLRRECYCDDLYGATRNRVRRATGVHADGLSRGKGSRDQRSAPGVALSYRAVHWD